MYVGILSVIKLGDLGPMESLRTGTALLGAPTGAHFDRLYSIASDWLRSM
jgi:hypothetical protein